MLRLGLQCVCGDGRISRRALVYAGGLGVAGLALDDLFRLEASTGQAPRRKARSIILLWLWGGPSHLDTFDPKPQAPVKYRGPFAPIATRVPGIQISELLPQLAARADRFALVRSLHCRSNDHGIAGTIGLTGSDAGGMSLGGQVVPGALGPAHGAVVSKVLGFDASMPRFVTLGGHLHQGKRPIRGEGGGPLGPLHDPLRADYDPADGVKLPQLDLIGGQSADLLSDRQRLREALDGQLRALQRWPAIDRLDQFRRQALGLLTSPEARNVFDLSREGETLRRRYGMFRFGQCCLLARRLVEAGVRLVQVNWSSHVEPVEDTGDGGWDMHDRNFQQLQDRHAWMLDQALSALLDDLSDRGLLGETIVVALGEFGRTPRINEKAGRDHWERCYSGLVAGGGLRVGQVVGASDARGELPVDQPVTPADLFRTLLQQMGIGTTQLTAAGLTPRGELIEALL
jgi:hypothetical protein